MSVKLISKFKISKFFIFFPNRKGNTENSCNNFLKINISIGSYSKFENISSLTFHRERKIRSAKHSHQVMPLFDVVKICLKLNVLDILCTDWVWIIVYLKICMTTNSEFSLIAKFKYFLNFCLRGKLSIC